MFEALVVSNLQLCHAAHSVVSLNNIGGESTFDSVIQNSYPSGIFKILNILLSTVKSLPILLGKFIDYFPDMDI